MELPSRQQGDILLPSGEMLGLRQRLRRLASGQDLSAAVICAYDSRTRMLPFYHAATAMAPAGVRAIGSALADVGIEKTRIVLQQWNPNVRPSLLRIDGRIPDLLLISSLQIHSAMAERLIRDIWQLPPDNRPLIIAGGPKAIYEPWDFFSSNPDAPSSADLAVTGEEYVLLAFLEILLSERADNEPLRQTFRRIRDAGALDSTPGLVYARTNSAGAAEELVDTGIQRLVGNLDELPFSDLGFALLEPPSRRKDLASAPLAANRVKSHNRVAALVITSGCRMACPYCPIPAYNQRQLRSKTGGRLAEEMHRLYQRFGLRYYFGADDNFFNDQRHALELVETLAKTEIGDFKLRRIVRWGTEATVHGILQMKDHLKMVHKAGVRGLWIGVEDLTATLVRKGQGANNTLEAFKILREHDIVPMPMLMHHDSQPLYTPGKPYGLLNQVRMLRKVGAVDLQVLMLTPAPGSKLYEPTYTSGQAYDSAAGRKVEPRMMDGNFVVASDHPRPWRKQLNLLIAYAYFYNPLRFFAGLVRPRYRLYLLNSGMQITGMRALLHTIRPMLSWALRLRRGPIRRRRQTPASSIPFRGADGGPASHAIARVVLKSSFASGVVEVGSGRQEA